MDPTVLARMQFGITTVYHFFFVPLTLGLSVLLAIMETMYVRSGNESYKRMVKFFGKLFLINFAMGVVTGIVQEFQFGMNWANYSRFVGDIFGAPLAIEGLLAFFLESTFIGIWLFGWDRISKNLHAAAIWLVAIGANMSALWILIANSFMHEPVGYQIAENGRAVMTDFGALLANPHVWYQFPHTVLSGFTTAGFFVLGISVYYIVRKKDEEVFRKSLKIGSIFVAISVVAVGVVGHFQGLHIIQVQPMKMSAAEALWNTEKPAAFSIFTIVDETNQKDLISLPKIPYMLSLLSCNNLDCEVKGVLDLQKEYEQKYGAGNYIPSINVSFFSFRLMVGLGLLMIAIALIMLYITYRKKPFPNWKILRWFPLVILFPYLANTGGWLLTELGRQPWVVYGLMKTENAMSPTLSSGMVLTTLIGFTLLYGLLMVADIYLLIKFAKGGLENLALAENEETRGA